MMDVVFEVLKFLGYSAVGFSAGYQVCKIRRNTEEIKEAVVAEHNPDQDGIAGTGGSGGIGGVGGTGTPDGVGGTGGTGGTGGQGGTYTSHSNGWQGRLLGIVVLAMSIVTVASSVYTNNETRQNSAHDKQVTACQAEYNKDFSRAVAIRGQYAEEDRAYADKDRAELYKMIVGVINPALAPEQRRVVIENWVKVTAENDVARKKNDDERRKTPLPNLDARNCGEVK